MFGYDEPYGYSVFCDDIRQETGNKLSYMGIYPGVMFVPSFPCLVSRFAIAVTFLEPLDWAAKRTWAVPLRLFFPGSDDAILTGEIPAASKDTIEAGTHSPLSADPDVPLAIIFQATLMLTPLNIPAAGRVKVRAYYADGHTIKMGSLRIEQQPADRLTAPIAS